MNMSIAEEIEPVQHLRDQGFGLVEDGGAVIVIGDATRIPRASRPSVLHKERRTLARRFNSAQDAVLMLIEIPARTKGI